MSKFPSQTQDKFTVRFPDGMRDEIARIAEENGRSMNSEIVQVLQDYIDSRKGGLPPFAIKDIDNTMKSFKEFLIKEYEDRYSNTKDKK